MDVAALIADPAAGIADIAAHLDGLSSTDRWAQVRVLGRDQQRVLYRKADGSRIGLDHFVGDAGALVQVVHDGVNTLPAPALRRFQKRICRPASGDKLFGYNEGPTRRLIGPGYFIATTADQHPQWARRGGVVIDYYQVPGSDVVPGWPSVVPNSKGLQRFVFHQTRDFIRRVSTHVSIGAVFRHDKPLDHYFVLCRPSH